MRDSLNTNPNDYAFPAAGYHHGITFREYAAVQALAGILASRPADVRGVAMDAVAYADALIQELSRPKSKEFELD